MPKHQSLLKQLFGHTAKWNSTDFLSCHLLLILLSPRICCIIKNIPGALHAFLSCSQCDQCSVKLLHFFINAITVWTTLLVPHPSKTASSLWWLLWAVSGALWYSISGFSSLSEVLNSSLHSLVQFKSWNIYGALCPMTSCCQSHHAILLFYLHGVLWLFFTSRDTSVPFGTKLSL